MDFYDSSVLWQQFHLGAERSHKAKPNINELHRNSKHRFSKLRIYPP